MRADIYSISLQAKIIIITRITFENFAADSILSAVEFGNFINFGAILKKKSITTLAISKTVDLGNPNNIDICLNEHRLPTNLKIIK